MSGHSHWAGIKHKKEITDQKRSKLFSKLLKAISIAARSNPDIQFNPRLRTAVEKAKENNIPQENIERAIKRAEENKNLEELIIGAYGPENAILLIEVITDSKNRSLAEIKNILNEQGLKFAEPGNVLWAFDPPAGGTDGSWQAKFKQEISEENKNKLSELIQILENYEDVQKVHTNF